MNAFELLQKWPSWEKAGAETIFKSPAWMIPVRWGDKPCVLRRADVKFRDVMAIKIRYDDEDNCIWLGNRESFPDLSKLWDVKNNLPDELKLALIEKECGMLFQILENAVRRQLNVVGIGAVENRESATGFEIIGQDGRILASFNMKVTQGILRNFGLLKYIDVEHPAIQSMTRNGRAEYAAFGLKEEELAGLAPGDCLVLPESGTIPPKWTLESPNDELVHIQAPETVDISFAQFASEGLPEIPEPTALEVLRKGRVIARGRFDTLGKSSVCAIEEVL